MAEISKAVTNTVVPSDSPHHHLNDISGHGAHECPGVGNSLGRHLHLWKVEARATISLRLGLHWVPGLTSIKEMAVPSAMHALGEQRWLVVWPCLLLMPHQAKKGSQLSRWLRIPH